MTPQETQVTTETWEYRVEVIRNPQVDFLQDRLNELGADGWEIVTSVTTVKSWLNLTGNELVFVLKRPGVGTWGPAKPDPVPY